MYVRAGRRVAQRPYRSTSLTANKGFRFLLHIHKTALSPHVPIYAASTNAVIFGAFIE